jgi:glucokinase
MAIKLAAGIDIGGTNSRFGIVDAEGKILAHDSIMTTDFPDAKKFAKKVAQKISDLLPNDAELVGTGIGAA